MSIKYHAVTLAAVLFALAAGIALGAGVLGGERTTTTGSNGPNSGGGQDAALEAFTAGFAEQVGPGVVGSALEGAEVLVVEVPGVTREETDAVIESLRSADATVVGNIALTEQLTDPAERQFADGVATQSLEDVEDLEVADNSYGRVGTALARALVSTDGTDRDADGDAILAAFVSGELIEVRGDLSQTADTVVFVAGEEILDAGHGSVIAEIAGVIDASAAGVVIAGPSAQSTESGLITALAESEASMAVSTFDVLDSPLGVLTLPLVVAAEVDGTTGAYGSSRASGGALPN